MKINKIWPLPFTSLQLGGRHKYMLVKKEFIEILSTPGCQAVLDTEHEPVKNPSFVTNNTSY